MIAVNIETNKKIPNNSRNFELVRCLNFIVFTEYRISNVTNISLTLKRKWKKRGNQPLTWILARPVEVPFTNGIH